MPLGAWLLSVAVVALGALALWSGRRDQARKLVADAGEALRRGLSLKELEEERRRQAAGSAGDGCTGGLLLLALWAGVGLGALYLLVRFVKWAWEG